MRRSADYAPTFTVADLFCGCGGLSLGFSLTRRFDVIYGLDIKPEAIETFASNHGRFGGKTPAVELRDVRRLKPSDVLAKMKPFGVTRPGELDCLIGGPPCEGFSQNRTIKEGGSRVHKFIEDERNELFRWFVALAGELRPKIMLIENVPDLIRHRDGETREQVFAALRSAGYTAEARVLNAAEFGVPQMRRRAFFLAQRIEDTQKYGFKVGFPRATHRPYPMMHATLHKRDDFLPGDSGYWVSVHEAIGDLPTPTQDDNYDHGSKAYQVPADTAFRRFVQSQQGAPFNHIARRLGAGGLKRLRALKPGQACSELPDGLRPKGHYHYSYTRLSWPQPARTITKFVYHVGSGQFGHPEEDRAITIREAARLQSFPDDFSFIGTNEIRDLSALVGSAVPPLLGHALAREILHYLDTLHLASMRPQARSEAKTIKGDAVLRRMHDEVWRDDDRKEKQIPLIS